MLCKLMCFQIHLGSKHYKFLLEALTIGTQKVVSPEVIFEVGIVAVVVGFGWVVTVADEAPLVLMTAVFVKLVRVIEARPAKVATRVALKSRLIYVTWLVVASGHMYL